MAWNCPECGKPNDDLKCTCGYAYFRVLGVAPDASKSEVKKTYQYLLHVWEENAGSHDALSRKRAEERLEKINAAFGIYKHIANPTAKPGQENQLPQYAIPAAAAAVLILVVAAYFFFRSPVQTPPPAKPVAPAGQTAQPQPAPAPAPQAAAQPAQQQTAAPLPAPVPVTGTPEQAAIDAVRKSRVLDRMFTVEALMKKWSDENAGKLQFLGWKSKKIDDQIYVVSYIASDGMSNSGFYFDIDLSTGAVRHLADHPELKEKYGIR